MNKRLVAELGLIVLMIVFMWLYFHEAKIHASDNELYAAQSDTLHHLINKSGLHEEYIASLEMLSRKQLSRINTKDSLIRRLQAISKHDKNVTNAIIVVSKTQDTTKGKTIVSFMQEKSGSNAGSYKDSTRKCPMPTYSYSHKDKWEDVSVIANKDSTSLKYTVFNDFEIKQTLKSNGWFKPSTPIVKVTNNNPRTETINLREFSIITNPKHGTYFFLGAVTTAIAMTVRYHFLK